MNINNSPVRISQLTAELLLHQRSFTSSSHVIIPDPDPLLLKAGVTTEIYRELTTDSQVYAAIQQRKSGTACLNWQIKAGQYPEDLGRQITQVFRSLDIESVIQQMLDAIFLGFSAAEIVWQEQSGLLLPQKLIVKPQEWFCFNQEGLLCFRPAYGQTSGPLPQYKILLVRHQATLANPYGEKVLSRCYWPVVFKRSGLQLWVTFTEKYGMPFLVAKQPRNYSSTEADGLLKSLEKMLIDTVGILPDDSSVEFIQGTQSATSEVYNKFLDFCNAEIAKAILSQTLTTDVKERGTYAAARTHQQMLRHLVAEDVRMIEKAWNELITLILQINGLWQPELELPIFELYENDDSNKTMAERDRLLRRQGIRFSKEYYMRQYNLRQSDFTVVSSDPPQTS